MQGGRTLGEPLFLDKQAGGVPFGAMNAVRRELRVEWNELLLDWSAEPSLAARLLNGRRQSPPAVEAGRLDRSLNARGAAVHCPKPPLPKVDTFTDLHDEEPPIAVAFFPLSAKAGEGSLLVVHDLSFIDRRAHEAEFYMALALIGVAAGLGLLATAIVLALLRGWNRSLRQAIDNFNLGRADYGPRQTEMPIGRDIEAMLSELRLERKYADSIHVEWSPNTLHQLLDQELPGAQVIVVSNREPYIHNLVDGRVVLANAGERPRLGAGAGHARLRRRVGRAWLGIGGSRHG